MDLAAGRVDRDPDDTHRLEPANGARGVVPVGGSQHSEQGGGKIFGGHTPKAPCVSYGARRGCEGASVDLRGGCSDFLCHCLGSFGAVGLLGGGGKAVGGQVCLGKAAEAEQGLDAA